VTPQLRNFTSDASHLSLQAVTKYRTTLSGDLRFQISGLRFITPPEKSEIPNVHRNKRVELLRRLDFHCLTWRPSDIKGFCLQKLSQQDDALNVPSVSCNLTVKHSTGFTDITTTSVVVWWSELFSTNRVRLPDLPWEFFLSGEDPIATVVWGCFTLFTGHEGP
jgi:hypothetical protein